MPGVISRILHLQLGTRLDAISHRQLVAIVVLLVGSTL